MYKQKTAKQQKLAIIQRAEGEREAVIQVAQGGQGHPAGQRSRREIFCRQRSGAKETRDGRKLPARECKDRYH